MVFALDIGEASRLFPQYTFLAALTPSVQKAAFHVQDHSGQDLCLKIISPECDTQRVRREIDALLVLTHPNVGRLMEYTFSSSPGRSIHYLVEEFVAGTDLSVQLHGPWSVARATVFFAKLCDGLAALQAKGLVHRDIKPSNIRVRPDDTPVLIDFGLVRHLRLPDLTNTEEGAAIGTPKYFAPEQARGTKHDVDHRTDIFATGVLLYEALVGQHPFYRGHMSLGQLYDAICESRSCLQATGFLALPSRLRTLVTRMLSEQRIGRPAGAGQVAAMLRAIGGF